MCKVGYAEKFMRGGDRARIVLFGAARFVYEMAQLAINFETSEIVVWSDNDNKKWGISYEGFDVVSPKELLDLQFDYIVVGAWYSYTDIRNGLLALGIPGDKIMPMLKKRQLRFLTGIVDGLNQEAVRKVFIDGTDSLEELLKVNKINADYEKVSPVVHSNKDTDFGNYPLIAHACGGYVNGEKQEYTNSLEALQEALDAGFEMVECDVWGVQNGNIVLGSRLKMQYPTKIDYTLLSLDTLLRMISCDRKKKVILDIKYNTMEDLHRLLAEIDRLVCTLSKEGMQDIRRQIIIESFDEESTAYIKSQNWECILTDYRNEEGTWMKKTAVICCRNAVKSVLIDALWAKKNTKYVKFLFQKNIDVICYTTDEITDYVELKKLGVTSVLTNFLKPSSSVH